MKPGGLGNGRSNSNGYGANDSNGKYQRAESNSHDRNARRTGKQSTNEYNDEWDTSYQNDGKLR